MAIMYACMHVCMHLCVQLYMDKRTPVDVCSHLSLSRALEKDVSVLAYVHVYVNGSLCTYLSTHLIVSNPCVQPHLSFSVSRAEEL